MAGSVQSRLVVTRPQILAFRREADALPLPRLDRAIEVVWG